MIVDECNFDFEDAKFSIEADIAMSDPKEVARAIREMIEQADGAPEEERKLSREALDELVTEIYEYCTWVIDQEV